MIEAIKIDVCEELAGQIADRQPTAALERRKEIVAVEIEINRLLRIRAIDDRIQKRERRRANDAAADFRAA
jgi:hypothetical protein